MLEDIFKGVSSAVGIEKVRDFGVVYQKELSHSTVEVSLSIEKYKAYFFLRIAVSYRKGLSGKTRVIKWPYSDATEKDLSLVIEDIKKITLATSTTEGFKDNRTSLGRWFDSLTGRKYYGYFELASPHNITKDLTVSAEVADSGKETLVSLKESRKGHGFILAHPPYEAFQVILQTLKNYSNEA
jgi:hypothetical protein